MFTKEFLKDRPGFANFNVMRFQSSLTGPEIVKMVKEKGICEFLTPDKTTGYTHEYSDRRIVGGVAVHPNASCCAFTKDMGHHFVYLFTDSMLTRSKLELADVQEWLNKLNEHGFDYTYLGAAPPAKPMTVNSIKGDKFHYILSPRKPSNPHQQYGSWIAFRELFLESTLQDFARRTMKHGKDHFEYTQNNIPHITMMFHRDFKVPFFRAWMYAHICGPNYSGLGFMFSDTMQLKHTDTKEPFRSFDFSHSQMLPYVNMDSTLFHKMLAESKTNMNNSFSPNNLNTLGAKIATKYHVYDFLKVWQLFVDKQYQTLIDYLNDFYEVPEKDRTWSTKEEKEEAVKEVTAKKKTARKIGATALRAKLRKKASVKVKVKTPKKGILTKLKSTKKKRVKSASL